jgi:hypothetical protein
MHTTLPTHQNLVDLIALIIFGEVYFYIKLETNISTLGHSIVIIVMFKIQNWSWITLTIHFTFGVVTLL